LQYGNDNRLAERDACLDRAMEYAGRGYLPFKVAADVALRQAKHYMSAAQERLSPAHPFYKIAGDMLEWLNANAHEQPVGGEGEASTAIPEGFDLRELLSIGEERATPAPSVEIVQSPPSGASKTQPAGVC